MRSTLKSHDLISNHSDGVGPKPTLPPSSVCIHVDDTIINNIGSSKEINEFRVVGIVSR